ncbi:MAG: energy transducer TonB [Rhodanobacteraceae bacterium]
MKRHLWLLLAVALPGPAFASGTPVQESMVVTGSITVNPQGGVAGYTVRDLDKLPPAARQIIQTTVPRWQFVPIMKNGKAVAAEAGMSLRIVADMVDQDHATIQVAGAAFGCDARPKSNLPGECPAGTAIRYAHRDPPRYPIDAVRARVGGEVFLVLQIDRDGRVSQTAVRQVNLYTVTDQPAYYRKTLADASLRAASKWQFRIPTRSPNGGKAHWIVEVPIDFSLDWVPNRFATYRRSSSTYGQWNAYIPGPVQDIPWAHNKTNGGSDAVADNGQPFTPDPRFVLETPLGGGTS